MPLNLKLHCPDCRSKHIIRYGTRWIGRKRVQRWQCQECGRITTKPNKGSKKQGAGGVNNGSGKT